MPTGHIHPIGQTDLLDKSETWSFRIPLDRIADALSLLTSFKEQPFTRWVSRTGKPLTDDQRDFAIKLMQHMPALELQPMGNFYFLLIIFDDPDDAMMFKLSWGDA